MRSFFRRRSGPGHGAPRKRALAALAALLLLAAPGAEARDLSLAEAIETALSQNTSLKVTAEDEQTAKAQLRQSKGQNGVSASASSGLNLNQSKGNSLKENLSAVTAEASLPLYTGGKNEAAIASSELGVKIAGLNTERARENLKYNVIKAYFDALEARHTIDVNQDSVNNYQAHLTNVEQLFTAGTKARMDVLRAQVQLSDAQQTLIKSQNAYEIDLASLRNYLDIDRSEPLTLTDDFVYDKWDADMDSCIGYAMRNRKDLLADEAKVEQSEQSIKEARAGNLPQVSLTASADPGLSWEISDHSWSKNGYSWGAGVRASWNVFDSGVTKAQIDEAETARDKAKFQLSQDTQAVDLSVRTAYYNMREAEHRMASTQTAVDEAQEDRFIASEKYRAGEGLMLDVIDAETALRQARLNHISAQYDYVRYKAEVVNAMGIPLTQSEQAAADRLSLKVTDAAQQEPLEPEKAQPAEDRKDIVPAEAAQPEQAQEPAESQASSEAAGTQASAEAAEEASPESAEQVADETAGNEGEA